MKKGLLFLLFALIWSNAVQSQTWQNKIAKLKMPVQNGVNVTPVQRRQTSIQNGQNYQQAKNTQTLWQTTTKQASGIWQDATALQNVRRAAVTQHPGQNSKLQKSGKIKQLLEQNKRQQTAKSTADNIVFTEITFPYDLSTTFNEANTQVVYNGYRGFAFKFTITEPEAMIFQIEDLSLDIGIFADADLTQYITDGYNFNGFMTMPGTYYVVAVDFDNLFESGGEFPVHFTFDATTATGITIPYDQDITMTVANTVNWDGWGARARLFKFSISQIQMMHFEVNSPDSYLAVLSLGNYNYGGTDGDIPLEAGTYYFLVIDWGYYLNDNPSLSGHLTLTLHDDVQWETLQIPCNQNITLSEANTIDWNGYRTKFYTFTISSPQAVHIYTDNYADGKKACFTLVRSSDGALSNIMNEVCVNLEAGLYFLLLDDNDYIREEGKPMALNLHAETLKRHNDSAINYQPIQLDQTVSGDKSNLVSNVYLGDWEGNAHAVAGYRFAVQEGHQYKVTANIFSTEAKDMGVSIFQNPLTDNLSDDIIGGYGFSNRKDIAHEFILTAKGDSYYDVLFYSEMPVTDVFYSVKVEDLGNILTITDKPAALQYTDTEITLPFTANLHFDPAYNTFDGGDALLKGFILKLDKETSIQYAMGGSMAWQILLFIYDNNTGDLLNDSNPYWFGDIFTLPAGDYTFIFSDNGYYGYSGSYCQFIVQLKEFHYAPLVFDNITIPYLNDSIELSPQAGASFTGNEYLRGFTFTLNEPTTLYFYGSNKRSQFGVNMYLSQQQFDAKLEGVDSYWLAPSWGFSLDLDAGVWYIALGDAGFNHSLDMYDKQGNDYYTVYLSISTDSEDPAPGAPAHITLAELLNSADIAAVSYTSDLPYTDSGYFLRDLQYNPLNTLVIGEDDVFMWSGNYYFAKACKLTGMTAGDMVKIYEGMQSLEGGSSSVLYVYQKETDGTFTQVAYGNCNGWLYYDNPRYQYILSDYSSDSYIDFTAPETCDYYIVVTSNANYINYAFYEYGNTYKTAIWKDGAKPEPSDPAMPAIAKIASTSASVTEISVAQGVTQIDITGVLASLGITATLDNSQTLPVTNMPFAWTYNLNNTEAQYANPVVDFYPLASNYQPATVSITQTVGIENPLAATLSLYPNPVTDYFKISGLSGGETVKILNMNGKVIASSIAQGATTVFAAGSLPQGVYLVTVQNGTKMNVLKFVKK